MQKITVFWGLLKSTQNWFSLPFSTDRTENRILLQGKTLFSPSFSQDNSQITKKTMSVVNHDCIHLLPEIFFSFINGTCLEYPLKVLETLYIKSKQTFTCKQKEWLLGLYIICLVLNNIYTLYNFIWPSLIRRLTWHNSLISTSLIF